MRFLHQPWFLDGVLYWKGNNSPNKSSNIDCLYVYIYTYSYMISSGKYIMCMDLFLFGSNMLSDSILQGSTAENSQFPILVPQAPPDDTINGSSMDHEGG